MGILDGKGLHSMAMRHMYIQIPYMRTYQQVLQYQAKKLYQFRSGFPELICNSTREPSNVVRFLAVGKYSRETLSFQVHPHSDIVSVFCSTTLVSKYSSLRFCRPIRKVTKVAG